MDTWWKCIGTKWAQGLLTYIYCHTYKRAHILCLEWRKLFFFMEIIPSYRFHKTHYLTLLDFTSPCTVNVTIEDINISPIVNGVIVSLPKKKTLRNISLFETKWKIKHCQRHNGPEGWVHITSSLNLQNFKFRISIKHFFQNLNQTSVSLLNLNLNYWSNLASESWPRFNFVTSTKHQHQNTD